MAKTHFARTGGAFWSDSNYHYTDPTGNVLYAGSTQSGAATGNGGRSPEDAYSTLVSALTGVVADSATVIRLCVGHQETITGAAGVSLTTAYNGLSIIGEGSGRQRPVINFTTAVGASFDIAANRILIENVVFDGTGFDALTAMVNVSGSDVTFRNCEFVLASASAQAVLGILATSAATRLLIDGCTFYGTTDAGTTNAVQVGGADFWAVRNSTFFGAYASASGAIQNTAASKGVRIENVVISNGTASSTKAMIFNASTSGWIRNVRMQILSGTAPMTAAGMSWLDTTYAAAYATSAGSV